VELRACPNVRGEGRVAAVFTRDPDEVASFVAAWSGKPYGVYFGAGTRVRERGTAEDVGELPALWVDLDKVDKAHALEVLKGCYCPPTFIVDSGRGLHAWWMLDEAAEPSPDFVDLLRGLRRIFAGDPAVCDIARIMRLPGTENSKYDAPLPVSVIHSSDRRYSLSDLKDWASWQGELIGEQVNPFLAAADRLGMRSAVSLEDIAPGKIHEVQLRVSASMVSAGRPEDEIVAELLTATKLAAGEEGLRWNWKKEESGLREMVRGAQKKFAQPEVISLNQHRQKTANGGDDAPETPASPKTPAIVRAAKVAREAWGRPLITVRGELWTYEGGIWHQFDSEWEHRLRVCIQGSVEALRMDPTSKILGGAYRWLHERPDFVRHGVVWDVAGVVVGENGALHIESGEVAAHTPEHYATRRVACRIDRTATCPTWMRFLAEALPDGAALTLQEWFGAALVRGKVRELAKGLIVYGPSRTGKTQITEVVRALLGGNTCGLRVRAMSERFGMQPLVTCSGWIADDAVGLREEMDAEAYKVIVTGESVSVERKNKTNVEVAFDLPVLLTMNNYPIVRDDSDAVYNRSLVLPMTRQWSEEEAQPVARQVVATELSGVLNWALEGWQRLKQRGRYDPPEVMVAAGKEFKGQNNPMEEFVELCLEQSPMTYIMRNDLLRIFNNWLKLELQSRHGWSGKAVGLALSKNTAVKALGDKVHRGRVWCGVRFTQAALAFEDKEFGQAEPSLDNMNHPFTPDLHEKYGKPRRTVF
jgi:P4 family phage/plasmid primase-like protien